MSVEMITALSSIVLSVFTLIYTIISNNRQSILQVITATRLEWFSKVRELLGNFAHSYRTHNVDEMMDIEAKLELFMRRDVKEYRNLLDYLNHCVKNDYCEHDYEKLLLLSSYVLARSWQRTKIDVTKYHISDKKAYQKVDELVSPLFDVVMSYDEKHRNKQ